MHLSLCRGYRYILPKIITRAQLLGLYNTENFAIVYHAAYRNTGIIPHPLWMIL